MQTYDSAFVLAGGRDFVINDRSIDWVNYMLRDSGDSILLVCGEARGADQLCHKMKEQQPSRFFVESWPAEWDDLHAPGARIERRTYGGLYNADAGYLRNARMAGRIRDIRLDKKGVLLFPGGTGTNHMRNISLSYNLRVANYTEGKY